MKERQRTVWNADGIKINFTIGGYNVIGGESSSLSATASEAGFVKKKKKARTYKHLELHMTNWQSTL